MKKDKLTQDDIFDPSVVKRFVDKLSLGDNGCIEWTGALNKDGYGDISIGSRDTQHKVRAHRWALQFALGGVILPSNILSCHKCDNEACVNPLHLFPGTHEDNMRDMVSKERSAINFSNAKLNWDIVDEIRTSILNNRQIAEQLKVSKSTVSGIRNKRTWQDENRPDVVLLKKN